KFAGVFARELLEHRTQGLTGAAPLCPKVHDHGHRVRALQYFGFKVFFTYIDGPLIHSLLVLIKSRGSQRSKPQCTLRLCGKSIPQCFGTLPDRRSCRLTYSCSSLPSLCGSFESRKLGERRRRAVIAAPNPPPSSQ